MRVVLSMSAPKFFFVTSLLQEHVNVPGGQTLKPSTRLREDLGMTDEAIAGLLKVFSSKMRFPFDEKPGDQRTWFMYGLSHERSEDQKAAAGEHGLDYGAPETIQRLYQVVFRGFMDGPNFNEIGSS